MMDVGLLMVILAGAGIAAMAGRFVGLILGPLKRNSERPNDAGHAAIAQLVLAAMESEEIG